jgi:DNA-binding Lrp family transcriptional regulator
MAITLAELDRLELSEEARAIVQQLYQDRQAQATALAEATREARQSTITGRVAALQEKGFSPGFCAEYERIALGDDGNVAVVLNLSENGSSRDVEQTATQLMDRLINSMAFDDSGKLALAAQGNLVNSPIEGRPPVGEGDAQTAAGEPTGPKSADDLLAEWEAADPSLVKNFRTTLAESPTTAAK